MNWSFRLKLQLFALVLSLFGVGVLAVFFLRLYESDKKFGIFESELMETRRNAASLENLLSVGRTIAPERLGDSSQIILIADKACDRSTSPVIAVSEAYQKNLVDLGLTAGAWAESLDTFLYCNRREAVDTWIIPFKPKLVVPYLGVLIKERLALISMEQFQTVAGSVLMLLDENGALAWSADARELVDHALDQAKISPAALAALSTEALRSGKAGARELGSDGLAAFAPVAGRWTLLSLSYLPTLIAPVRYAFTQFLLLAAAVLLASLLFGRSLAALLIRPLDELRASAERIGGGDFSFHFEKLGTDEFSTVKKSMNAMTDRIAGLIDESRKKANLESELSLTRDVQALLLPNSSVRLPHAQLSSYLAFADQCGGDWWGYLETRGTENKPLTIVMIGDVTGHGVPSALMTAAVRGAVSVLARWVERAPALAENPAAMLTLLNLAVHDTGKGTMHVTFLIAVLDAAAGKLHCANAAHVAGYLIHPADGATPPKINAIGKASITLGESPGTAYLNEAHDWRPGSKLFLYTDGLIDVVSDGVNLFDRKTLRKTMQSALTLPANALVRHVLDQRERAAKGVRNADDMTVVVCESLGFQAPEAQPEQASDG